MIRLPTTEISPRLLFSALLLFFCVVPKTHAQSFEQVAVGASHICALDASREVACSTTPIAARFLPPEDLPLMRQISAGQQHTCGVTVDDSVVCWGEDAFGVLQAPGFDAPVSSLSSGFNHTCAVDINNRVQCWGLNTNGQLNVPDIEGGFTKVDAARNASCGIDTSGDVHCWSTDSFFNTDVPIAGPFVEIDIDSNQACGIKANGDIECWAARDRLNHVAPTNGPYIDLTVTNSAICGLRTDQLLDCSFAAPTAVDINTASEEYPLDVLFTSIERSSLQFRGVPICGIRADNGTISCFGGSDTSATLPAPPGADSMVNSLNAANITLGLTAQIYGRNQVELFWNQLPGGFPPISVEVYRDDELLEVTPNSFSFYDNDSSVMSDESRYRVRTVDEDGNFGEFSNDVLVDRGNLSVSSIDSDADANNRRLGSQLSIENISFTAFVRFVNSDAFILTWEVDNDANVAFAGYEIRIDNEPVGFTESTTFIGGGANLDDCRIYSVAAVADDGAILDYSSVAFGRNAIRCPSAR